LHGSLQRKNFHLPKNPLTTIPRQSSQEVLSPSHRIHQQAFYSIDEGRNKKRCGVPVALVATPSVAPQQGTDSFAGAHVFRAEVSELVFGMK
jgi:hypothetical protein